MSEGKAQKRPVKSSKKEANGQMQSSPSLQKKLEEKAEREKIVLWRHPIKTIHYSFRETLCLLSEYLLRLWNNKLVVSLITLVLCALYVASLAPGPHQMYIRSLEKELLWAGWWIWLGVLSSVGLGTGLHTFLLYLGPHIASVTMAAYLCESLEFPSPPYPDDIVCPDDKNSTIPITIWSIMAKVRPEAFYWGAGTALGELPPYFMARSARLSGIDPDDEEMLEFEELQRLKDRPEEMSFMDKLKLSVERLVEKVGFFGILACASIPNPLFDLAGITCGHFLVPFWTFFGATLIGKAIIKMHIQKLFVIIAFNEPLLERAVEYMAEIPVIGKKLQQPFGQFLENQKTKFHGKNVTGQDGGNIISWIFEKFIVLMILYFVISLINSFAQNYHKRQIKNKQKRSTD